MGDEEKTRRNEIGDRKSERIPTNDTKRKQFNEVSKPKANKLVGTSFSRAENIKFLANIGNFVGKLVLHVGNNPPKGRGNFAKYYESEN